MATAYHNLSDYDFNSVPNAENMRFGIVVSEWSFFFFRGRCTHHYTVIIGCFPFPIMIAALPLVDFSPFFINI